MQPLLAGMVLYVLATAVCAFAPSAGLLIAFRLLQGLTGAAGIVIARAVVRDLYDGVAMARFFSTLMLISGVAPIVAPSSAARCCGSPTGGGLRRAHRGRCADDPPGVALPPGDPG